MSAKHKAIGKNYRAKSQETIQENPDNFFPTYHALTRHLLDVVKFPKDDWILEPAAGAGDITKVLNEYGYDNVLENDIKPRRGGMTRADFLSDDPDRGWITEINHIVTNPPFNLFNEFLEKSCRIAHDNICMIAPMDYLHGVERYSLFYEKGCHGFRLKTFYAFVRRPLFDARWRPDGPMPTGATSFGWYHFLKYYQGDPVIKWLHNNDDMGQPIAVEQIMLQDIINENK